MKNALITLGVVGVLGAILYQKFLSPAALKARAAAAASSVLGGVEQSAEGALDKLTGGVFSRAFKSQGKTGSPAGEVAGAGAAALGAFASLFGKGGGPAAPNAPALDNSQIALKNAVVGDEPRYTDDSTGAAEDPAGWIDGAADPRIQGADDTSYYSGPDQQQNKTDSVSSSDEYDAARQQQISDAINLDVQSLDAPELPDPTSYQDAGYAASDPATVPSYDASEIM